MRTKERTLLDNSKDQIRAGLVGLPGWGLLFVGGFSVYTEGRQALLPIFHELSIAYFATFLGGLLVLHASVQTIKLAKEKVQLSDDQDM